MGVVEERGLPVGLVDKLLNAAFGVPSGVWGRIGGQFMSGKKTREIVDCVVTRLELSSADRVLEVGFGPGIAIDNVQRKLGADGLVVGIDPSQVMLDMAVRRNVAAIRRGKVELTLGTVDDIPFSDSFFDKVFAMNSLHVWPDPMKGRREIRRVLKPGGLVLLSFAGPARKTSAMDAVESLLGEAGFSRIDVSDSNLVVMFHARKLSG